MQKLFELKYLPIRIFLEAMEPAKLPRYLGSALRGVLGRALYDTDREAYAFLYENGKNSGGEKDIVNPYMILPPLFEAETITVAEGEKLAFDIVLLGCAVKYTESVVRAFERLSYCGIGANRYFFRFSMAVNSSRHRILWADGRFYSEKQAEEELPCIRMEKAAGAVVRFQTPLRIRRGGMLVEQLSFQTLVRNIVSRMTRLSARYGGQVDAEEAERIVSLAERVTTVRDEMRLETLDRYSNRTGRKMDFSGIVGEIEYEGNLAPFVPWLLAAEILHVGRNTTFGMGKMEVYFR